MMRSPHLILLRILSSAPEEPEHEISTAHERVFPLASVAAGGGLRHRRSRLIVGIPVAYVLARKRF